MLPTALILLTAGATVLGIRISSDRLEASEPSIARLTDVPGLGIEPEDQLRDEVISAWEAYSREEVKRDCMAAEGHTYEVRVPYPHSALSMVAGFLEVNAGDAPAVDGPSEQVDQNGTDEVPQRSYTRVLYDESAEDLAYVNDTGSLPDDRSGDFATGGCWGEAFATVEEDWDIRNLLGTGYRMEVASRRQWNDFADLRNDFLDCLRTAGAEVEGLDIAHPLFEDREDLGRAFEACQDTWKLLDDDAEASLIDADRAMYEAHARRYEGILDRIRQDKEFRSLLWLVISESGDTRESTSAPHIEDAGQEPRP